MAKHRIGVVGAGRVGAALALALRDAGHEVVAASARSSASRTRIATLLPATDAVPPAEVAARCDLLLLTVPDDALPGVVGELAGALRPEHVVVHTSGRHGVGVLAPAASAGAARVALHPAMTFAGTAADVARLATCVCGVTTADERSAAVARGLVADLGATMTAVPEQERARYHAALAHGANHLVTLVGQAIGLLCRAGSDDPAATLRPLLQAALDNALAHGDAALTGPVVRGDVDTVAAHVDALADAPASTLAAYRAMARATAEVAAGDGRLAPEAARDLLAVLDAASWQQATERAPEPAGPRDGRR